jgi:hypothetical protein
MLGSMAHGIRLVVVVGMIGLGVGQVQAQSSPRAGHTSTGAASRAAKGETAAELLYQGKILPIVTDVYNSISSLGTGLTDLSNNGLSNTVVTEIAGVADQFAGEQQRFEAVKPVPKPLHGAAATLDQGLRNLTSGTRALVIGLRAANNGSVQHAGTTLQQGLKQFQLAVSQVRKLSGSLTPPSSSNGSNKSTPVPTPVIKGLP